jgi:GntR family transcriptional regulator
MDAIMIDIQHDSPVPIHEQITSQLMALIASEALPAGATLADYRTFAQQLLTNPQVVAKAYADLEWEGVLRRHPSGGMEVAAGANVHCRVRLQDTARQGIRQAVRHGLACGLPEDEIRKAVEQALAAPPARPLAPADLHTAIKKSAHASSHRDSQGIQVLSPEKGGGPP